MATSVTTLKRTVGKPLTTSAIAGMKPGQILSDGGIDTGAGRLKIRKRQTSTGSVAEWLYIYWSAETGKRVTIILREKGSRYSPKEQEGCLTIAQAQSQMLKAGAKYMVIEASSHSLDQDRLAAVCARAVEIAFRRVVEGVHSIAAAIRSRSD